MIKYSIVVPCYNVEKYLLKFFSGIPKDRSDFEMIFVNDKSTDNTKKMIEEFIKENKNFKLINHTINKGVGETMNTGLKHISTNWLARLDPDDYPLPDYFLEVPKYLSDENSLIRYKFKRIDMNDEILPPKLGWYFYFKSAWGCSLIWNIKYYKNINYWSRRSSEDLEVFGRCYKKIDSKKEIFINKYLSTYRVLRPNSITSDKSKPSQKNLEDAFAVYNKNKNISGLRAKIQKIGIKRDIKNHKMVN